MILSKIHFKEMSKIKIKKCQNLFLRHFVNTIIYSELKYFEKIRKFGRCGDFCKFFVFEYVGFLLLFRSI
jgi:hypothetical protein